MERKGPQKLAVLLCRFSDTNNNTEPPRQFFEDLFLNRNTGGLNDYWHDVSHGAINLDGSEIFGWQTLNISVADFIRTVPGRDGKVAYAVNAFGLNIGDYAAVVGIFNAVIGGGGSHGWAVLAQAGDLNLTFLAHETGHAFGLDHSYDRSGRVIIEDQTHPGEYYDRNDIMSAMNVDSGEDARFGRRGPILNAPNMERMGWLDPTRVWHRPSGKSGYFRVELVSLGHPEIPGYLVAKVGSLYVEFRTQDGWDDGIFMSCIEIRKMQNANSYLYLSNPSTFRTDWLPGSMFGPDDTKWEIMGGVRIFIDSFDKEHKKAHITIHYHVGHGVEEAPILPDWNVWKRPKHLNDVDLHPEWNKYIIELENTLLQSWEQTLQLNRVILILQQDLLMLKQQKFK